MVLSAQTGLTLCTVVHDSKSYYPIYYMITNILVFAALLAGSAGASDNFGRLPDAASVAVPGPTAPKQTSMEKTKSGGADMAEFMRRLESIGLNTSGIRQVTSKIDVVFSQQWFGAAAEYGYLLNNLYIEHNYKDPASGGVRFDLTPNLIDTLMHEYVHASRDVYASKNAPAGSPARAQYDSVAAISADLRANDFYYRYAGMKADEVSAYFFGGAIAEVFSTADDIVFYNTKLAGAKASTMEEALKLGGKLLLPTDPNNGPFGLGKNKIFGRISVYETAQFKDNKFTPSSFIHWQERQFIKDDIYRNFMGLNPPRDTAELLQRLNTIDNAWIREVRAKVAKARLENAGNSAQKE
jgi:hypothetical protein